MRKGERVRNKREKKRRQLMEGRKKGKKRRKETTEGRKGELRKGGKERRK